ncbi:hypothetical protein pdam_00013861 [Pocillopora damicornis]|uniref:Phospholipase A2 domain-containing protein n=1 Tax=Pocillopora damicornis TaxID=46731 RepID=A0A3M6ULE3_POCDA|nr:hypothetical protein pdam_00013861 [Pocillopora damicornis]
MRSSVVKFPEKLLLKIVGNSISSKLSHFISEPASYYWLSGECRFRLCKCDAAAAKCFKKNRYQEKYRKYPQNKCTNDKPSKSDDETTQTLFPL